MDFKEEENELNDVTYFDNEQEEAKIDENDINENEPVEEPVSSNSAEFISPVKDAVGKMTREGIKSILKSPWFWGIAAFVILILLAFLVFHMDYDMVGVGNPRPKYYQKSPTCGKVFLTYENDSYTKARQKKEPDYVPITDASLVTDIDEDDPEFGKRYTYKEYEYDTYISGIVWTDNNNAKDVDNEIMYQAMAIVARSRLIHDLPVNNCVVLKNYNEQAKSFTELDGSEEKYSEITKAVVDSKGIMIGKNGTVINALYDSFSYEKKRFEEDDAFNKKYFYHMMNRNEAEQQIVPAEWIDDLEELKGVKLDKVKVSEVKKLTSMSLYGGKYLLEKVDSQYELYRILEYYFGRDIEYYYLSSIPPEEGPEDGGATAGSGCMWWPIGSIVTEVKDGVEFASGPPSTVKITSYFGFRNIGLEGASKNHLAIDIGGGMEGVTNIIAASNGKVLQVHTGCVAGSISCGGGLGNYVVIEHGEGLTTRYGHMYTVSVNVGDSVKRGQVIGKMGNTGTSTGPHLDFQVRLNGTPVNPLNYVSTTNPRKSCLGDLVDNDFIAWFSKYAVEDMHSSDILASITISQAILESNWGKSSLALKYNNYFGMKAGKSWKGKVVELPTTECNGNDCYRTTAKWRWYDSVLDSVNDHSALFHTSRYNGVVGEKDYRRAIQIIKNGGYATDPNYVSKIINLIEKYGLANYDTM